VSFQREPETAILEIRDFGNGIPAERLPRLRETCAESGVGLAGMRERMKELNGKLEIGSDGQGTSIRAIVPLPRTARFADPTNGGQISPCASAD
jgi:signal transduction histidine kinase